MLQGAAAIVASRGIKWQMANGKCESFKHGCESSKGVCNQNMPQGSSVGHLVGFEDPDFKVLIYIDSCMIITYPQQY